MAITRQISQYARGRVIRRVSRSVPWIGAAIAVLTVGAAIRRKGAFGGVVDTALVAVAKAEPDDARRRTRTEANREPTGSTSIVRSRRQRPRPLSHSASS